MTINFVPPMTALDFFSILIFILLGTWKLFNLVDVYVPRLANALIAYIERKIK